jgi:DNA-binding winged helix-turn-helix (wHTH) protein
MSNVEASGDITSYPVHDRAAEFCERDALIRAVWPEDAIYEAGVRDSSLAQLVRRLRVKVEPEPGAPQLIETVTGRGYLFRLPASQE